MTLAELLRNHADLATREGGMYYSCEYLSRIAETAESLEAENDKLRELVRDMWRFTGTACKKYPRLFDPAAQGGQTVQLNMIDAFEQRMRELGVEVDG